MIQLVDHLGNKNAIVNQIYERFKEKVYDQEHDENIDRQLDESRFLLYDKIMVNLLARVKCEHKCMKKVIRYLTRIEFFGLLYRVEDLPFNSASFIINLLSN